VEQNEISIVFLKPGSYAMVKDIKAGIGLRRRLEELGLVRNQILKIIKNDCGPLIIMLGESRLVIGRGAAFKIFVEEIKK
jgi:ferrous iron transport protein A